MAELSTIARPYANAAFSVADASAESLDAWSRQLAAASAAIQNPEISSMLSAPSLDNQKRTEILLTLAERADAATPEFKRFVELLVSNQRYAALPAIAHAFEELKNQKEDSAEAEIFSAYELTEEQVQKVVSELQPAFRKKLKPVVSVDPSLIGGVKVVVGDQVLDHSVKAQLERLRQRLTV